jgi:hypothetical protein
VLLFDRVRRPQRGAIALLLTIALERDGGASDAEDVG